MIPSKTYLEKLDFKQLPQLAAFIVNENISQHIDCESKAQYESDIYSILEEEEEFYPDANVFVIKDVLNQLIGAIRVLKWNLKDVLPIEKIFDIDPSAWVKDDPLQNIFHIGRFAIKKEIRDVHLFKQLMVCAIAPVCQFSENIAFAEIDAKLLRILNLLGISTTVLGASVEYLGSETIPVAMSGSGLMDFYQKNKSLVANVGALVHQTPAENYSLV